jgi:hypothetical protein
MIDLSSANSYADMMYVNFCSNEKGWTDVKTRADSFAMTIRSLVKYEDTIRALEILQKGQKESVWAQFPQKESELYSEMIIALVKAGSSGSAVELHKQALAQNVDLSEAALKVLENL